MTRIETFIATYQETGENKEPIGRPKSFALHATTKQEAHKTAKEKLEHKKRRDGITDYTKLTIELYEEHHQNIRK